MPHTTTNGPNTYSVDMAHWWVNENDPLIIPVRTNTLMDILYQPVWRAHGVSISPIEVAHFPSLYPSHIRRIKISDLSYPIILYPDGNIFDGTHRLLKAHLNEIEYIPVIILSKYILRKLIVSSEEYDLNFIKNGDAKKIIRKLYSYRFDNVISALS